MSIEFDSNEEIQDKATEFDGFDNAAAPVIEKEEAAKENEEVQLEGI